MGKLILLAMIGGMVYMLTDMASANDLCGNGPLPQGYTKQDRAKMCGHVKVANGVRAGFRHVNFGVGVALAQNQRNADDEGSQQLSGDDESKLEAMAKKALGALPDDARGYAATILPKGESPGDDCVLVNEVGTRRGASFTRYRCPRGTVGR